MSKSQNYKELNDLDLLQNFPNMDPSMDQLSKTNSVFGIELEMEQTNWHFIPETSFHLSNNIDSINTKKESIHIINSNIQYDVSSKDRKDKIPLLSYNNRIIPSITEMNEYKSKDFYCNMKSMDTSHLKINKKKKEKSIHEFKFDGSRELSHIEKDIKKDPVVLNSIHNIDNKDFNYINNSNNELFIEQERLKAEIKKQQKKLKELQDKLLLTKTNQNEFVQTNENNNHHLDPNLLLFCNGYSFKNPDSRLFSFPFPNIKTDNINNKTVPRKYPTLLSKPVDQHIRHSNSFSSFFLEKEEKKRLEKLEKSRNAQRKNRNKLQSYIENLEHLIKELNINRDQMKKYNSIKNNIETYKSIMNEYVDSMYGKDIVRKHRNSIQILRENNRNYENKDSKIFLENLFNVKQNIYEKFNIKKNPRKHILSGNRYVNDINVFLKIQDIKKWDEEGYNENIKKMTFYLGEMLKNIKYRDQYIFVEIGILYLVAKSSSNGKQYTSKIKNNLKTLEILLQLDNKQINEIMSYGNGMINEKTIYNNNLKINMLLKLIKIFKYKISNVMTISAKQQLVFKENLYPDQIELLYLRIVEYLEDLKYPDFGVS